MPPTNSKQPKRNPGRAAKDRWAEEKLMTSDTSQLIDLDLVKILAHPEAWNCLDEAEKKEILDLLPEDLHPCPRPSPDDPNAKIPPLPESFLRYSNNWRDGVRHFQLDLQNGRYDPVWLREAEEAMRQRAEGKFDKFKEEEYEQFWGQKQKMDKTLAAGQSRQVKLSTLIEHGVVREGDVWKYSRAFSKGRNKLLIEKEAKIVAVKDGSLTFAFPPDQRVFLSTVQSSPSNDSVTLDGAEAKEANGNRATAGVELNGTAESNGDAQPDSGQALEAESSNKRKSETETPQRGRGRPRKMPKTLTGGGQEEASTEDTNTTQVAVENINAPFTEEAVTPVVIKIPHSENDHQILANASENHPAAAEDVPQKSSIADSKSEEAEEIIVSDIQGPSALASKILEADGRVQQIPHGNAWKEFRAFRNNQDMGSLWEVRQAWFQKNS
ncbi:hypothetical protein BBP40_006258 [Aspergillus hancockii]|nr:hypothetical protein BBP40_006258 [Aspergillus hancockii]